MSEFTNLNDLMFPGLPPVNNECRLTTARQTIHNETAPTPSLPEDFSDSYSYLRHLVYKEAANHYGSLIPKDVEERINMELSVFEKKKLADYILFIWDSMKTARESLKSCLIFNKQGSISCSMVAYLLNITFINPLKYHFPFEMFVNESKQGLPYICIDVDTNSKMDFVALLKKKYGNRMASIYHQDSNHEKTISICEWAIANKSIESLMPTCKMYDKKRDIVVLCPDCDMDKVREYGAIVQTILDWKPLSTINKTLDLIKIKNEDKLKFLNDIPMNDVATMDVFRNGDTEDIYLFDKEYMRENLVKLCPDTWTEIVLLLSLRGKDDDAQLLQEYIRRKNAGEVINYPIPEMAEVLDETYGLLLFREQFIRLAHKLGNLSLSDACTLSLAMGRHFRRNQDVVMNKFLPLFLKGGCEKGYPQNLLEQIYTTWWQYGGFTQSINKYWDMGITLTAYQLAYLKTHYPKEWTEQQILTNIFRR